MSNINLLADSGVRNEEWYFMACQDVWNALSFCRMQCPELWRLLRVVHNMGKDFALSLTQALYVMERLASITEGM